MAKIPAFIDMLDGLGFPKTLVDQQARCLREAGLISRGKRGIGSPSVTVQDASTMLLTALATDAATSSPETLVSYASLRMDHIQGRPGDRDSGRVFTGLHASGTPLAALRTLIDMAAADDGGYDRLRLTVDRGVGMVSVDMPADDGGAGFSVSWAPAATRDRSPMLRRTVTLDGRAIAMVAKLVAPAPEMELGEAPAPRP